MDNMADATDEIDVAITKGENYGLIDKLTGYKFPESPELHIDEGTNSHRHPWMVSTLLFNVLWDIVDEFKHYCGENGIDPTGKGKCMGEFPYLYEDYNNLHDYMEELKDLGAPLDILLDEYPLQLNKIQLSPDYPYRSHEHNHNPNRLEEVDKFLSRRLSVVRENIYTLSDGALLGEGEQHKLENQMSELFNLHKHESSEHLFNWSIKDVIKEHELTMNPSDNKRNELRDNLFDQLDDSFGVFPHPDGELEFEGQPVAIYSFDVDEFVPFDSLYDPLSNLLDRGVDQESVELFIEIITEWISYRMTEKPEMFNEETDVFGQGLLDPVNPKEFEGDDEEWEDLLSDIEPGEKKPSYDYTDGRTDPEKGFVAPSKEVTDNICTVESFCQEQGPITFGQLKALVEAATSKRIAGDLGRGVFKTLWRLIPFFIPQILLAAVGVTATRAINKIVTPALKDTKGYKSWWGKVVLKAMDIAEGDYIPDVALGDDPLGKVFFISDGLLEMIKDKYKLKFARYVSDVAASRPDNEPVPDWFVENLLRDYLNQKFLLDPPLQPKKGLEFEDLRTINESTVTESGLSPELEIGDVIKVIDIDRERERGKTQYTTPGEQMRPEKFVPYTVVDKKSNGSQSKWSWKYTLVPPNQVEAYEKSLDRGWGNYEGYEKLLYPWIYEWIPADTPMANKVDRLTLTEWEGEHEPITQKELNPELEKGDHVKIISIDGEHANMPKKWEVYVVNSVHGDKYQNQRHYGLYPMDQTDEQLTSSMLAGGGKRRELYLYRGDEWMKVKNSQLNPLIKKLNGMEIEIDTTKYDLGYVDEETGESTGNLFFEITNPRFSPISYGGDSPVRNDMFHYDLLFTKEESGILVDWFDKEELEKMFNQDGIKGKINKAVYENYLKLYGIPQKYVRVQEILVDNLLLGLDFRNNFVSESYDNEDLCDELTISTEEELREKLEGMSIGKGDRDEIEGLIGNMLSDTEHLHPSLPSVESETDFDISNTYGRKIQSILCTHERKNISNIDEESTILETFEVISDLNKAIVVN